jgi:hypothetical protein
MSVDLAVTSASLVLECPVCVEKYNKSSVKSVSCDYCKYTCCRKCCERYLLSESVPKCMNSACGREWSRGFIVVNFTKTFVTHGLREHRENVLFEHERALLPATQPDVEEEIRVERVSEEVRVMRKEVTARVSELYAMLNAKERELNARPSNTERRVFVRACGHNGCRGFLSSQWKCGLCSMWSCPDCLVVKGLVRDVEHVCLSDDLATAKLLKSDTKNCPRCATSIFKIEGCDQMWCTQCQTAFSWMTGRIETRVHNPHYYEWMRRTGGLVREDGDVMCGRELTTVEITDINRRMNRATNPPISPDERAFALNVMRCVSHISQVVLPRFTVDRVLDNRELRIAFMRGRFSENEFKTQLQRNNKRNEKRREVGDVLRLFVSAATDIVFRYRDNIMSPEHSNSISILREVSGLVEYSNECLHSISVAFSCARQKLVIFEGAQNPLDQINVFVPYRV